MKKFPVAERFTSPQGEGLWAGTLMHFIRFAGCSVGKKFTEEERSKMAPFALYQEKCTTYDGREFICDTDFRTKEALTIKELLDGVPKGVKHICLTGGEPLNQPLKDFLVFVSDATDYKVHIETSGTVSLTDKVFPEYDEGDSNEEYGWLWITVSPKKGVLPEMIGLANEIKLLVDDQFDVAKIPEDVLDHRLVWLSPVNDEFTLIKKNQEHCIRLLHEHPNWRLAIQAHKVWGVR